MSRARSHPCPNTVQPGHYIFWQQCSYQVTALDPGNALLLHVQLLAGGLETTLSLLDLLAVPGTNPSAPLFAPTLEALHQQIEEHHGRLSGTVTDDFPMSYAIKAHIVTSVVDVTR